MNTSRMNRTLAIVDIGIFGAFCAAVLGLLLLDPQINPQIGFGLGSPAFAIGVGLIFWTALTLLATFSPVEMPRGIKVAPTLIPIMAAAFLGGPLAAAFVGFVGSTEKSEIKGKFPLLGVLADHSSLALGGMAASGLYTYLVVPAFGGALLPIFLGACLAGVVGVGVNTLIAALMVSCRLRQSVIGVLKGLAPMFMAFCALIPFAWLMAFLYGTAGAWATLLAAAPLYTVRAANQRFIEMREIFVQAISALAHALDARDIHTAGHSHRMSEVAVDIALVMRLSQDDVEQLEWAGILHDVGKIGVPDSVLLKPGRLDDRERELIERHPVIGALIVAPVTRLSPEVPLIRHHHERWDGHGYPDGLAGEAIPRLARILAVADSFEAMTAQRPYRMSPLTPEEAYTEIVKCSGTQFDPEVVVAFGQTKWARGEYDRARGMMDPRLADVSMVSAASRLAGGINDGELVTSRRREIIVEFVDPHGDEIRARAAAVALNAQALAAAETAVRHGHGHPHDDHTHDEPPATQSARA